jgi:hypothetical protein
MTPRRATLSVLLVLSGPVLAAAAKAYPDPAAATDALIAAARSGEVDAVVGVLGDRSRSSLASGDAVADRAALQKFVAQFDRSHTLVAPDERSRTLLVGADEWPFPIPLVQGPAGWTFDPKAGEAELLARRVGQNELDAIQVCLGYVNAQRDYLDRNPEDERAALRGPANELARQARRALLEDLGRRAGEPAGSGVSGALREATRRSRASARRTGVTSTGSSPRRVPTPRAARWTTAMAGSSPVGSAWSHTRLVREVGGDDLRGEPGRGRLREGPRPEDRKTAGD